MVLNQTLKQHENKKATIDSENTTMVHDICAITAKLVIMTKNRKGGFVALDRNGARTKCGLWVRMSTPS